MNMKKFNALSSDLEHRAACAYFFFSWIIENMFVPGHVESWLMIMDFDQVNLGEIPVKQLRNFVGSLQRNFRGRMFRNIMVNTHWLLQGVWGTVKGWLDPFVQQKITICKNADIK